MTRICPARVLVLTINARFPPEQALPSTMAWKSFALLCLAQTIAASPAPRPANVLDAERALITPSPTLAIYGTKTRNRRGIVSDITAAVESDIGNVLSDLGTDLPTWVASGLLPQFQGLPTGSAVLSSANISSSDLDAMPTSVLNIPVSDSFLLQCRVSCFLDFHKKTSSTRTTDAVLTQGYGNWTNSGWNLRVHGNVYKTPNISESKIDELANKFVIGSTPVSQLPPSESAMAVNLTRAIFVVQQKDVNVTINVEPAPSAGSDGTAGGGGGVTPPGM